jgi:hypothetical protein
MGTSQADPPADRGRTPLRSIGPRRQRIDALVWIALQHPPHQRLEPLEGRRHRLPALVRPEVAVSHRALSVRPLHCPPGQLLSERLISIELRLVHRQGP